MLTGPVRRLCAGRDRPLPDQDRGAVNQTDGHDRRARPPRSRARVLDEVEKAVVGKREALIAGARRGPRRGPRAARGLPGPGQDPRRPLVRAGARPGLHAAPSSPPTCCPPTSPGRSSTTSARRVRVPPRAAVHRPAARRRDQPHAAEDPGRAARGDAGAPGHRRGARPSRCPRRSTCSPPPTRSSTRAPTRCPRRSSTGSCCGSASATRPPARSATCSRGGWRGARRRSLLDQVTDAAGLLAMQAAVETVTVDESVGRYCVDLAAATRDHPHVLIGASPRGSLGLVLAARAFAAAARPRLRHPRGRQGGRPLGARPPDHRAARAVDERRQRPPGRRRRARPGADAAATLRAPMRSR